MACFFTNYNDSDVSISRSEEIDNITLYVINVRVGTVTWYVTHRYSDFYNLNTKLVSDHGVSKDIIPPKKIIRTKCPLFIENRRKALEIYLKTILNYLQRALPRVLALFLDFHLYDIYYLLQDLALKCFQEGEAMLSSEHGVMLNPLELYAITKRLKQPCPEVCNGDKRRDFSHVLDVCSQAHTLNIIGSDKSHIRSNIILNDLKIDLLPFKMLNKLIIKSYNVANITGLGCLRETLNILKVTQTNLKNISSILLCDSVHKVPNSSQSQIWSKLTTIDLSDNHLTDVDESIALLPNTKTLTLNRNEIQEINNLARLPNLSTLNVSANRIVKCENLNTKLGNLLHLDLSQNYISSLEGFSKLYSLESLDVSSNRISSLNEIEFIGRLPCLENLRLTGNPVSTVVDYRVKVLERFGPRACDLCLDNETPSQKELDTVCILQAIRIVKEGKTPTFDGSADTPLFLCNSADNGYM